MADAKRAFDIGVVDGFHGAASQLGSIDTTVHDAYWKGYRLGGALVEGLIGQLPAAWPMLPANGLTPSLRPPRQGPQ